MAGREYSVFRPTKPALSTVADEVSLSSLQPAINRINIESTKWHLISRPPQSCAVHLTPIRQLTIFACIDTVDARC
jgi:hypothetical protein